MARLMFRNSKLLFRGGKLLFHKDGESSPCCCEGSDPGADCDAPGTCQSGTTPTSVFVTLSGFAYSGGFLECTSPECTSWNGTFELQQSTTYPCVWIYHRPQDFCSASAFTHWTLRRSITTGNDSIELGTSNNADPDGTPTANFVLWSKSGLSGNRDCSIPLAPGDYTKSTPSGATFRCNWTSVSLDAISFS